jgi:hypothetical protein
LTKDHEATVKKVEQAEESLMSSGKPSKPSRSRGNRSTDDNLKVLRREAQQTSLKVKAKQRQIDSLRAQLGEKDE